MVRPRAKYAAAIAAVVAANRVIGSQRNPRFGSQRSAYQLQKTPSAVGSANAPTADSSPLRARRPSTKSVVKATSDVQREAGASEGSRDRNKVSRFGHPKVERTPNIPRGVTHKNHDTAAQGLLPAAPASRCRAVTSVTARERLRPWTTERTRLRPRNVVQAAGPQRPAASSARIWSTNRRLPADRAVGRRFAGHPPGAPPTVGRYA